jgi:hypothetical protein
LCGIVEGVDNTIGSGRRIRILMDKRLQKKHKRQVARGKNRVRLSEPDLRTPEQIKAAREASRPATDRAAFRKQRGAGDPLR